MVKLLLKILNSILRAKLNFELNKLIWDFQEKLYQLIILWILFLLLHLNFCYHELFSKFAQLCSSNLNKMLCAINYYPYIAQPHKSCCSEGSNILLSFSVVLCLFKNIIPMMDELHIMIIVYIIICTFLGISLR